MSMRGLSARCETGRAGTETVGVTITSAWSNGACTRLSGSVRANSASRTAYDYYKVLATIPGDQAFRPLSESECTLVK